MTPRLVQSITFKKGEVRETLLKKPSKEAQSLKFYNLLPKDPVGLAKWRLYARERALHDLEFRDALLQMAEQDVAFFAATFCWIHETRGTSARSFPIDLWEDQVDVLAWLAQDVGLRDILVEKSRGIGLSWLCCILCIWKWLFSDSAEIALVSKDDTSLDILGRPSTLMGKLDFLFEHLPAWIRFGEDGKSILKRTQSNHKFENLQNGTTILGFVPTSDKLRSGRYNFVFFDEFAFLERTDMDRLMAASQHTTLSRLFVSTHNGTGLFYYMSRDDKSPMLRIRTFWWANPDRFMGAYQSAKGRIKFIDEDYKHADNYPFIADGLLRSPWFDAELERAGASLQATLEELNGIAAISSRKLFRPHALECANVRTKPPVRRGVFFEDGGYEDDIDGPFRWFFLPGEMDGPFIIGADPSHGLPGGAYAALAAFDIPTGRQVASAALTLTPPVPFAAIAVHFARLLAGGRGDGWAQIAYETTGPTGTAFGQELIRQEFTGIWINDAGKVGYQNPDANESILQELARAISHEEVTIYDEPTVDEFPFYEYNFKNQKLILDWMGRDGHADRATATAICWFAMKRRRRVYLSNVGGKTPEEMKYGIDAEPLIQRAKMNEALWSAQFDDPWDEYL